MADNISVKSANDIVDACLSARKLCLQAIPNCMEQGPDVGGPEVVGALLDAAAVAVTTADLLARNSPHARNLLNVTALVMTNSARAIESHEHDSGQLRATYAACLRVAEACSTLGPDGEDRDDFDQDKTVADSFPASDPPPPPSEI